MGSRTAGSRRALQSSLKPLGALGPGRSGVLSLKPVSRETRRDHVLKWLFPLKETPEADEYQMTVCDLHPFTSF